MFERLTKIGTTVKLAMPERTAMYAFLKEAGTDKALYAGVDFYWAGGFAGGPVLAMFRWQEPDILLLRPPPVLAVKTTAVMADEYMRDALRMMVPSAVHEMTHRRQLKDRGRLAYWACSVPGLYYTMLDAEAFAMEKSAALALKLPQGEYEGFGDGERG